ncbi:MAG: hypothetical protein HF312_15495 [Ignavibacteria bacterium]|jgi:hypothetical protein|nr:hypothetical protein [Ignavibacteria bacterium]
MIKKLPPDGTRVHVSGFGCGRIVQTTKEMWRNGFVIVMLEHTPPVEYNMGTNPALVLRRWLQALKPKPPYKGEKR